MNPSFLIQEYVATGKETIMGVKKNEGLPPTLMFGLGGIFVETLKDVQFRLAPLSPTDAHEMIRSIEAYPVLAGVRGEKAADIEALADILQRLSTLASDFPSIDEMDLKGKNDELIKEFDRRDFSREDAVLWYQDQLTEISAPLDEPLLCEEGEDLLRSQWINQRTNRSVRIVAVVYYHERRWFHPVPQPAADPVRQLQHSGSDQWSG